MNRAMTASESRASTDLADRIGALIGSPRKMGRDTGRLALAALSMHIGRLERLTGREPASTMDLVEEGWLMLCDGRVLDQVRDELDIALDGRRFSARRNRARLGVLVRSIGQELATRGPDPLPSNVALSTLASMAGQVAFAIRHGHEAARPFIVRGYEDVTEAEVVLYHHTKDQVAES